MKSFTLSLKRLNKEANDFLPLGAKRIFCLLFTVLLLFHSVSGFTQILDFGERYKLIPSTRYPAEPLRTSKPLDQILQSGYHLSINGGVAFAGEAKPIAGFQLDTLSLIYNPMLVDGNRLNVFINNKTYVILDLPDWQLVPIAKFADSSYIACVSLFGKLKPGVKRPLGTKYVVGYHPAFENTLLGLRLFQVDFYLLDPDISGELPSQEGEYILGSGEVPPDPDTWQDAAFKLNQLFGKRQIFQSYLICDYQRQVTFSIDSSRFLLDNHPYFYFWRRGKTKVEKVEENEEKILYRSFNVIHLKNLSEKISSQIKLLHDANPAVYNSLVNVMRYAAFFRYCKRQYPSMWNSFLGKITQVSIYPNLETPSIVQKFVKK